jgi:hypothetical protein
MRKRVEDSSLPSAGSAARKEGRLAGPAPIPDPSAVRTRTLSVPPNPDPTAGGAADPPDPADGPPRELPRLQHPSRGRRVAPRPDFRASPLTPEQRLLGLDAWRRNALPVGDFTQLVGASQDTLGLFVRQRVPFSFSGGTQAPATWTCFLAMFTCSTGKLNTGSSGSSVREFGEYTSHCVPTS